MAKKPKIKTAPRVKIPIDRQTPRTTFGDSQPQPITRLPPITPAPKVDPNAETKA